MGDTAPNNPLSSLTLRRLMVLSLPKDAKPQLATAFDAVALVSHAAMLAVGFRLVGLGEDHRIETHSEPDQPSPLPTEWNAQSGTHAFRYKHNQSSMEYLLKINRMGKTAAIMGMGLGDDRVCTFDLKAQEYVSEGSLPLTLDEGENEETKQQKMLDVFISVGRLSDLGSLMRIKLIQKLVPSLQKEGYEEAPQSQSSGSQARSAPSREDNRPRHDPLRDERDPPARPHPLSDPLAQPRGPRRPLPEPMPGFEDEHGLQRPMRGMPPGAFPRIGDRDLYPQGLGPNDPIRGGVGPGLGPFGGGGGMHPTFDDPLFAGQGQRGGFDPQAPPGARYDPTGPGMGGHPRGAGMGGRPPNPFGGFGNDDFI